jgi:alpha/beta superfamily hydrolase
MSRALPLLLGLVLVIAAPGRASAVAAIDYAREDRWTQEVVPSIVVGEPVHLATPERARVLAILTVPSAGSKGSVIVVHGLGVHPDFGMINGIRTGIADAGYTTLSVQMPVLAAGASRDDYRETLPEAGNRIAAAIAYLRRNGPMKIGIVSHSMGSSMVNAYLARADALPIDAWAPVGMFGAFAAPSKVPVLDIIAEREIPEVRESAPARARTLPKDACSKQITMAGADHYFASRQGALIAATVAFFQRAFAGECGIAGG